MTPPRADDIPTEGEPTLSEFLAELSSAPATGSRLDGYRVRALDLAERVTTWGPGRPVMEVAWRVYQRDQSAAGSVLAAAVAYRIFIWLLPLALLLVGGLGLYAQGAEGEVEDILDDAGITGFIASSVAAASESTSTFTRVVIVVTSGVVFLYESYVLLRTLRAVNAFAWRLPVRPMPNPPVATLTMLALMLGIVATAAVIPPIRDATGIFAILLVPIVLGLVPAFYVLMNLLVLPHAARSWTGLLPGAVGFYVGATLVNLFNTLILWPWLARKEETYGVLGLAAGLLFSLFIYGRLIELAASLNAVLEEDRARRERERAARRPAEAAEPAAR